MIDNLAKVFKKQYRHLNWIEISKENLINNYQYLSKLKAGLKIAPVLKSNAYGHGILEVAKILDPLNPPFFCVDSLYEAYVLQKSKIKSSILITGYTSPENFKVKKLPFTFVVWDIETAKVLNEYQKGAKVHIKIDTGMHRLGVPPKDLPKFLKGLKKLKNLEPDGVMSHFAKGDDANDLFVKQIDNFQITKRMIVESGFTPTWYHISASKPLLSKETLFIISNLSNMARVGLALYGETDDRNLRPALKFFSTLVQIKSVKKGERVGYDGIYRARRDVLIGVIGAGYADGIDRRLSNKGTVYIDDKPCSIIGRVSMNMTTIDISKVKKPKVGQGVLVISDQKNRPNSVTQIAKTCNTIEHDILTGINITTKRIIV